MAIDAVIEVLGQVAKSSTAAEVNEDEFISYYRHWSRRDRHVECPTWTSGVSVECWSSLMRLRNMRLDRTLVAFVGDHGEEFLEHQSDLAWPHCLWYESPNERSADSPPDFQGLFLAHWEVRRHGSDYRSHANDFGAEWVDLVPDAVPTGQTADAPYCSGLGAQRMRMYKSTAVASTRGRRCCTPHARRAEVDWEPLHRVALRAGDGWRLVHNTKTPEEVHRS